MHTFALFLFVAFFQSEPVVPTPSLSDGSATDSTQDRLLVDVSLGSGCAQKDASGQWYGPDIDIWRAIAHELQIPKHGFELREVAFEQIFTDLEASAVDVGLACITTTSERLERVDFSQPYLDGAGIGVLMKNVKESRFSRFMSGDILVGIVCFWFGIILLFIITAGVVTWLLGRHRGKDSHYFLESIWGSFTTASTTGYGDVLFKLWRIRLVQFVLWAMVLLTGIVLGADLTSSLTVRDLSQQRATIADVHGKKIATVASTTSETLARSVGADIVTVKGIDAAYDLLQQGKVQAVVYDAPALRQYAKRTDGDLVVLRGTLSYEYYAVALQKGSPMKARIDRAILKIREDGRYEAIMRRWFAE